MTYRYQCKCCGNDIDVIKPMAEVDRVEVCSVCNSVMNRVWESSSIKTSDGIKG